MEFINPIAAIIALIVAIFSIPKTLHSINEHRRKKFRDELENYKEYFEKFYNCDSNNYPKLLRDKAAQTLTRSTTMNAELVNYFIALHEAKKANFSEITDSYHFGYKYINTDKEKIQFTHKICFPLFFKNLYLTLTFILLLYVYILYGTTVGNSLNIIVKSIFSISSVILSLTLIDKILNIDESIKFFSLIKKAQFDETNNTNKSEYFDVAKNNIEISS